LCRSMDMIFIDRERRADIPRVLGLIEKAWQKKQGVIVFPEGTSSKGDALLPFKPSLLEPAVKARFPVSYASLTYQTPPHETPAYLSVCWWGDMTLAPHALDLFRLSEFHAKIVFGAQTFSEDDRKVLAQKLRQAIEQQFTPVIGLEGECKAVAAQ
jgi:1-acyl-sn-glycerol-3-phosphate acyltransferase